MTDHGRSADEPPEPAAAGTPPRPTGPAYARPAHAPAADYWRQAPRHPARRRHGGLQVMNIILLVALVLLAGGTLAVFASSIGISVFLICGALALIPLGICVTSLVVVDRWEPEPKAALVFGFCWGAGMAVITALLIGGWVQPLLMAGNASADPDLLGAVVQAPLVEELCKGVGLLLLFFLRRRTFDGPLDGLVYAGMIAAGFAYTENILYFSHALIDGQGQPGSLVGIFFMRGLLSPLAHVMFTGALGLCVGQAARHGGTPLVLAAWVGGLLPAMALHALWNSLSFLGSGFLVLYVLWQVPLFILFILLIVSLRRAEARLTRERLGDYVPAGWFSPLEVPMLATGAGRRQAVGWAKSFGAGPLMRRFIRLATRLAFTRARLLLDAQGAPGTGQASRLARSTAVEWELLQAATATRRALLTAHAGAGPTGAAGPTGGAGPPGGAGPTASVGDVGRA